MVKAAMDSGLVANSIENCAKVLTAQAYFNRSEIATRAYVDRLQTGRRPSRHVVALLCPAELGAAKSEEAH